MCPIVICGLSGTSLARNVNEYKMYVFIFSTSFSETVRILRRTERDMITNYVGLHVKYPLFLSDFNET